MSEAYDLYQQGLGRLRSGMPAQATVALEKAKRLEPEKASIREALGIAYFRIRRWPEAEARVPQGARPLAGRRLRALRARPLPPRQGRRQEAERHLSSPDRPDAARRSELD